MLERAMNLDIKVHKYIVMGNDDARNSNKEKSKRVRIKRYDRSYLTITLVAIFRSKLSCM